MLWQNQISPRSTYFRSNRYLYPERILHTSPCAVVALEYKKKLPDAERLPSRGFYSVCLFVFFFHFLLFNINVNDYFHHCPTGYWICTGLSASTFSDPQQSRGLSLSAAGRNGRGRGRADDKMSNRLTTKKTHTHTQKPVDNFVRVPTGTPRAGGRERGGSGRLRGNPSRFILMPMYTVCACLNLACPNVVSFSVSGPCFGIHDQGAHNTWTETRPWS